MPTSRRVLGYARVSSAEQALGTSLADQQATIKAWAKDRGLKVDRMYVEAESAVLEKIERREQIQALMADVREGDLVLCAKLDRWSRDPEFAHGSVRRLLEKRANAYFIDERCDPSTSEGDTMLGFRVLFAREEHKRIRERTVGTRNLLRARGLYVEGTPPYGYRRSLPPGSKGLEKNILVVVPEDAEKVRQMFRLVVAGRSLAQIADCLELGKKRVWSSLHCRSYIGEIRTKDGWIRGQHEAIVPADLFALANEMFSQRRYGGPRPRSTPSRTDTWILRDVAHCAHCGRRMGAAYGRDRGADHYYRCWWKCQARGPRVRTGSYVKVDEVEGTFSPLVVTRLSELREEIGVSTVRPAANVDAKRERLAAKRARHLDAYGEGLMTRGELRERLAKIDADLLGLEAANASPLTAEVKREKLREVAVLEEAWRRADARLRRRIVGVLVERVLMAAGRAPEVVWRPKESINAEVFK